MHLSRRHVRWQAAARDGVDRGAVMLVASVVASGLTPASAATATANIAVSMTVPATCTVSNTNMAFGTVLSSAQSDGTATITLTCTNTTTYNVNLTQGLHSQCCWSNQLSGPGGYLLQYDVRQDAARTKFWGNTPNNDGVTGTGNGAAQTVTAYGRIRGGQNVGAGAYSDTVLITVTY